MNNFSVVTYTKYDPATDDIPTGYTHWADSLKMIIHKDGVTIELTSKEIKELVNSLPRTVGGTYK